MQNIILEVHKPINNINLVPFIFVQSSTPLLNLSVHFSAQAQHNDKQPFQLASSMCLGKSSNIYPLNPPKVLAAHFFCLVC